VKLYGKQGREEWVSTIRVGWKNMKMDFGDYQVVRDGWISEKSKGRY
jgi:hypothetical protein